MGEERTNSLQKAQRVGHPKLPQGVELAPSAKRNPGTGPAERDRPLHKKRGKQIPPLRSPTRHTAAGALLPTAHGVGAHV